MKVITTSSRHNCVMIYGYAWVVLILICIFNVNSRTTDADDYYDNDDEDEVIQAKTTTEITPDEMRFTYGEDDAFGPLHWRNPKKVLNPAETINARHLQLDKGNQSSNTTTTTKPVSPVLRKLYENTFCQDNWLSPINIETKHVHRPEVGRDTGFLKEELVGKGTADIPETLIISIKTHDIQYATWEFGHPATYHGIEIRPNTLGIIQLMDNFDPLSGTNSLTAYDFHFLSLFYCDLQKAKPHRTMHQIDGKRFPLELEFVFFRKITDEERPRRNSNQEDDNNYDKDEESLSTLYDGKYIAVIVSVLGEIGKEDNRYFQPVIEAATRFHGKDFKYNNNDIERNDVEIEDPWSPTWLLPDSSEYYYYDDGSFPVPPCWSVARYYIMKDPIKISQVQLDALTSIRTDREKTTDGLLHCTHSISLIHIDNTLVSGETPVRLNLIEYEIQGQDGKPRSEAEVKKRAARKRKRDIFRRRLEGHAAGGEEDEMNNADIIIIMSPIAKLISIIIHVFCAAVFL